jgi:hypothetical protein
MSGPGDGRLRVGKLHFEEPSASCTSKSRRASCTLKKRKRTMRRAMLWRSEENGTPSVQQNGTPSASQYAGSPERVP